jgi:hypothetical protein
MKRALTVAALIMMGCWHVYPQGVVLSAGETYLYQFTTLPLRGTYTSIEPPAPPFGKFDGLLSSFAPGGSMLFEMFESSTNDTPIAVQYLQSPAGGGLPPPPGPRMWADGAWQDLQGVVRFTMLSGSASVIDFRVSAVRSEPAGFVEYSSTIPEPGVLPLVLFGAAFLSLAAARGKAVRAQPGPR